MLRSALITVLLLVLTFSSALGAGQKPNDRDALAGLKKAQVIFDVRVADLEKLVFNLELLEETWDGLVAQGVKPAMVVTFRGPGVKFLTSPELKQEALDLIREMRKKGVRFEACSVAMRVFKVDPTQLVPEVKLVGNVLNSLVGYQNKGYAVIAMN